MDLRRFEDLLRVWQDGDASPQELTELEGLLRQEPALRRELVGSVLLEVGLYRKYTAASSPVAVAPRRRWRWRWEAVAAALVMAVSAFLVGRVLLLREPRGPVVAAGDVRSNGMPIVALSPGMLFEVKGLAPATIDLRPGARAILNPGCQARLLQDGALEVLKGDGSFAFAGPTPFAVRTAAGEISGSDAHFWMMLRPSARKSSKPELVLDVARGRIEVAGAYSGRVTLDAGQRLLFGPPPPGGEKLNRLLSGAAYPLAGAVDRALAAQPGLAIKAELEDEDGHAVYSVTVAADGKTRELDLDPKTGKVLENQPEDEDASAVAAGLKIPLKTAIEKALDAVPGRAIEAEAELENGRVRIEVKILGDAGVREVLVDGATGEILRQ